MNVKEQLTGKLKDVFHKVATQAHDLKDKADHELHDAVHSLEGLLASAKQHLKDLKHHESKQEATEKVPTTKA